MSEEKDRSCCEFHKHQDEKRRLEQENKELRTRVAELEAEAKMGNIPYKEAVKLRTRVAELESLNKFNEKIILYGDETTMLREQTKKIEELKKRVAELEKEKEELIWQNKEIRGTCGKVVMERNELQNRLSTLLKASEWMEKALERLAAWSKKYPKDTVHSYNNEKACNDELYAIEELAVSCLADFRAVKETMEKGAGK